MSSSSKVNYHALLQLPIVRKLKDKNKRLKDEIKVLKNVILYMESRNSNSSSCVKKEVIEILDDSSVDESDESNVNEPNNENITYSLPKEDDSKVVEFKTDGYYDYEKKLK